LSTLYIRHPSRVSVELADGALLAPACRFALVADSGTVMQQGAGLLGSLAAVIALASRVVLLLAASDVSLLRVKAPPLGGKRLKAALPNLIEEQLISDPADCVVVAAGPAPLAGEQGDGLLRVAVVERAWLVRLVQALQAQGARRISVLPSQLCLPLAPDMLYAAVGEAGDNGELELSLRLGRYDGVGLAVSHEVSDKVSKPALNEAGAVPEAAALQVLQALRALAPEASVQLFVPPAQLASYQRAADAGGLSGVTLAPDHWANWLPDASAPPPDLAAGLDLGLVGGVDWRRWRWPIGLAALLMLMNVLVLNGDWWRLKRDADTQRFLLLQTYKSAYPKEAVVIDPLLQMRQKVAAARADSGQLASDDFVALAAAFGQLWNGLPNHASIAALEYKERALLVRFKNDGETPFEAMKTALAAHNLSLSQQASGVWQIKSGK